MGQVNGTIASRDYWSPTECATATRRWSIATRRRARFVERPERLGRGTVVDHPR